MKKTESKRKFNHYLKEINDRYSKYDMKYSTLSSDFLKKSTFISHKSKKIKIKEDLDTGLKPLSKISSNFNALRPYKEEDTNANIHSNININNNTNYYTPLFGNYSSMSINKIKNNKSSTKRILNNNSITSLNNNNNESSSNIYKIAEEYSSLPKKTITIRNQKYSKDNYNINRNVSNSNADKIKNENYNENINSRINNISKSNKDLVNSINNKIESKTNTNYLIYNERYNEFNPTCENLDFALEYDYNKDQNSNTIHVPFINKQHMYNSFYNSKALSNIPHNFIPKPKLKSSSEILFPDRYTKEALVYFNASVLNKGKYERKGFKSNACKDYYLKNNLFLESMTQRLKNKSVNLVSDDFTTLTESRYFNPNAMFRSESNKVNFNIINKNSNNGKNKRKVRFGSLSLDGVVEEIY